MRQRVSFAAAGGPALRRLEREVFWEGFDQEARAYLEAHPGEPAERASYSGTALDRSRRAR